MPLSRKRKSIGMSERAQPSKKPKGIVKKSLSTKEHRGESEVQKAARFVRESRDRIAKVPADQLDNDLILEYVTHNIGDESPFIATAHPFPKNPEKLADEYQLHYDEHSPRLNASYKVHPTNVWEHLRRYKKFTIGDVQRGTDMSAGPGDYIMVKNDDSPEESTLERDQQWKAQVLEIRALDGEHVYIRVAWLNRPEDVPRTGRQAHHGLHELIPTNQMDVIDAMTVNGTVSVYHWDETMDDEQPDSELYFWRQTLDTVNSKTPTFSPLRKICIDRAPINPDKMIVQCGNNTCNYWMHVQCIAKDATESPSTEEITSAPELRYTDDELDEAAAARHHNEKEKRTAYVLMRKESRKKNIIVVTDKDGDRSARPLSCLHCGNTIP